MSFRITALSITMCACLLPNSAVAEVLLIDSINSAPINSEEGIPRPTRSMTMDQVSQRFGQPSTTHSAVGDPPITRWDYPSYSVFFEYDHVLTSVLHR